jgi:transposase
MKLISVKQAAQLFKVTTRTIYNWIEADRLQSQNDLYSIDDLQDAYDKRRKPKPRLRYR